MSNFSTFILGAAAGAAITLYFTKGKGSQVIKELTEKYDDKVFQLSDTLKEKVNTVDNAVKDGIDRAAYKLIV